MSSEQQQQQQQEQEPNNANTHNEFNAIIGRLKTRREIRPSRFQRDLCRGVTGAIAEIPSDWI